MSKNILVTGSSGQLGSELQHLAKNTKTKWRWIFADIDTLDITSLESIHTLCEAKNINVIINCAAYTSVDQAETNNTSAEAINYIGAKNLATIAKKQAIALVHISTDYVFDGLNDKPYLENDFPSPLNIYGKTKLAGEQAIQNINPANSIIIRTAWMYSAFGNNFVKTMLRLSNERSELDVVNDQFGSPTYAYDLAIAIIQIIHQLNNSNVKLFHYANEGVCSWFDFAATIFNISKGDCRINPIATNHYPTLASRPIYSALNNEAIKQSYNLKIPNWKDSLQSCLFILLNNKN